MAKILIFTDPHLEGPAVRMASAVQTMNWLCDLAQAEEVDAIVCCGDLTNRAILTTPEEIAGFNLSMVRMANLAVGQESRPIEFHLVMGNHDLLSTSRLMSTVAILDIHPRVSVHHQFASRQIADTTFDFLPYGKQPDPQKGRFLFTHNDFTGIVYNFTGYQAKKGFGITDFQNYESVFNGHIHLPSSSGNLINVGSVLPQRMDYVPYAKIEELRPRAIVLTTKNQGFEVREHYNPHATLYATLDYSSKSAFGKQLQLLKQLSDERVVHARVVCPTAMAANEALKAIQPVKGDRLTFRVMERTDAARTAVVAESTAQKMRTVDDDMILQRLRDHVRTAFPELQAPFEAVVSKALGQQAAILTEQPEAVSAKGA